MRQRESEYSNMWDGFDKAEYHYDEKKEKRYQSSIWKYLFALASIMLILTSYKFIEELNFIINGSSFVASYDVDNDGAEIVRYFDEDKNFYMFNVTGLNAVHEETTIKMYYLDDMNEAVPRTVWWLWFFYYAFFGIIFGISLWKIILIYRKKKY